MGEFTHKFSHPGPLDRLGGRRQWVCNAKQKRRQGALLRTWGRFPGTLAPSSGCPVHGSHKPSHCSECRAKQHPSRVSKRQGFWVLCFHLGPNSEAGAGTTRQPGDGGGPLCKGIMPSTARPGPHGTLSSSQSVTSSTTGAGLRPRTPSSHALLLSMDFHRIPKPRTHRSEPQTPCVVWTAGPTPPRPTQEEEN